MPNGNPDNPAFKERMGKPLTTEEARELGRKGGVASVKARAERKLLKEALLDLLSEGNNQDEMNRALFAKALMGDTKAYEVVRDTIGESPTSKHEIKGAVPTIIKDDIDGSEPKE